MNDATRSETAQTGNRNDADRDRMFDLLRGVAGFTQSELVADLARAFARHPDARLDEAFNHKQIASKMWARDRLFSALGGQFERIWIVGGWYGVLAAILFDDRRFSVGEISSYDIDPSVEAVATTLNAKAAAQGRFKAVTVDMYALDYRSKPDLIVNTSCEHVGDVRGWLDRLPAGTAVLLQSNNYFAEPEHINCVPSLSAFEEAAHLTNVLYAGGLTLKKYTRFMLIGRT
jgi:hypothetical protein